MAWEVFSKTSGQRRVRFLHGSLEEREYQALQEEPTQIEKLETGHDMSYGYLFALTCVVGGHVGQASTLLSEKQANERARLQVVWSVVISQGTVSSLQLVQGHLVDEI